MIPMIARGMELVVFMDIGPKDRFHRIILKKINIYTVFEYLEIFIFFLYKKNMSKILKFLAFFFLLSNYSLADVTSKALSKVSEKISEKVLSVIPGEGVTEFDIELSDQDNNDPRFNLLLLRNLNKQQDSNLFTQFSLHTQDVGTADLRYIANLGLGYRFLSDDQSFISRG